MYHLSRRLKPQSGDPENWITVWKMNDMKNGKSKWLYMCIYECFSNMNITEKYLQWYQIIRPERSASWYIYQKNCTIPGCVLTPNLLKRSVVRYRLQHFNYILVKKSFLINLTITELKRKAIDLLIVCFGRFCFLFRNYSMPSRVCFALSCIG